MRSIQVVLAEEKFEEEVATLSSKIFIVKLSKARSFIRWHSTKAFFMNPYKTLYVF